jgi:hypothetical protein
MSNSIVLEAMRQVTSWGWQRRVVGKKKTT